MSPEVYQAFERILGGAGLSRSVLEVGAVPGTGNLLAMGCLKAIPEKIGLNLQEPVQGEGWEILQGDAHAMTFKDNHFEAVFCNSTLEHDPAFWKTLSEMRRVAAPGGLLVIGVPGFSGMGLDSIFLKKSWMKKAIRIWSRWTGIESFDAGTLTLGEHLFPGDYYRFTEQALREVLLAGLKDIQIQKIMNPPRLIGWGRKA